MASDESSPYPPANAPAIAHSNRRIILIIVPVCVLLVAAITVYIYLHSRPTELVYSGTVETREIQVGSKVGGRVTAVFVEEGQRVATDAPLVSFESDALKAQLAGAKTTVEQASANFHRLQTGNRPEEIAVDSTPAMYDAMRSGKARIAIRIPTDYARNLLNHTTASVHVLVDGSDSFIAAAAVDASTGVALQQSLVRIRTLASPAIQVLPSVLYNPATRSANFFVPGLIAILLQVMIILLIAISLVRVRELGTLEQLKMRPIAPLGLMVGKMILYGVLGFGELCLIFTIMRNVFQVPIHGSVILLLLLSLPFLLTVLGIDFFISTRLHIPQAEAFQLAMGTVLPSVFLSGYIFLISTMPVFFRGLSYIIPASYYIQILRGIVLRGATFADLWPQALVLTFMGCAAILLAAREFIRQNTVQQHCRQ